MSDNTPTAEQASATDNNNNADQTSADQKTAGDQKKPTVHVPELVDLAGGVVGRVLLSAPKEQAKQLFKDLKKGTRLPLGEVSFGEHIKAKLILALDHSEFVGPGFNFDVFQASLKELLSRVRAHLKAKQDLNFRTSEQGGVLVGVVGGVQVQGQVNALMMSLELGTAGEVGINLMYMDPEQFKVAE